MMKWVMTIVAGFGLVAVASPAVAGNPWRAQPRSPQPSALERPQPAPLPQNRPLQPVYPPEDGSVPEADMRGPTAHVPYAPEGQTPSFGGGYPPPRGTYPAPGSGGGYGGYGTSRAPGYGSGYPGSGFGYPGSGYGYPDAGYGYPGGGYRGYGGYPGYGDGGGGGWPLGGGSPFSGFFW